jgi:hypothetical protein
MRSTAIRWPDHGDRDRHAHVVGLFDRRLDEFAAFYRPQLRHSPSSDLNFKF